MILRIDHPTLSENRTIFTKSVRPSRPGENVLKAGSGNDKIGGSVIRKGRWKGFKVLTCVNEERKTCPATCPHRRDCYGNNMPFATRYVIDGTWYENVRRQLNYLSGTPVALRLKVLGDFSGIEEVAFWMQMMMAHKNLHVWGFTAHTNPARRKRYAQTTVRDLLDALGNAYPDRWLIRHSGAGDVPWAANPESNPVGFKCPAKDTGRLCVDCGACWATSKPVWFPNH
jgi:hypothetical protein